MSNSEEKAAKLSKAFEDVLRAFDKSPGKHPELLQTPVRASQMWLDDLVDGYGWQPEDILTGGTPVSGEAGLVVVKDLFFHSVCPHHLLPYHGRAHVAYIPDGRIVGFSKLGRLVDCFAHRLDIQEQVGQNVADALVTHLGAKGAACILDAEQLCMVIRGVRKPGSRALTFAYAGELATNHEKKMELLKAVGADE